MYNIDWMSIGYRVIVSLKLKNKIIDKIESLAIGYQMPYTREDDEIELHVVPGMDNNIYFDWDGWCTGEKQTLSGGFVTAGIVKYSNSFYPLVALARLSHIFYELDYIKFNNPGELIVEYNNIMRLWADNIKHEIDFWKYYYRDFCYICKFMENDLTENLPPGIDIKSNIDAIIRWPKKELEFLNDIDYKVDHIINPLTIPEKHWPITTIDGEVEECEYIKKMENGIVKYNPIVKYLPIFDKFPMRTQILWKEPN